MVIAESETAHCFGIWEKEKCSKCGKIDFKTVAVHCEAFLFDAK